MTSGNDSAYAHYANFAVDSEDRQYSLTVSGYTGTAGEKSPFSKHELYVLYTVY